MQARSGFPAELICGCPAQVLYAHFGIGIGEDEAGGEAVSADPESPSYPVSRAFAFAGGVVGYADRAITGDIVRRAQGRLRPYLSVCRANLNL